MNVASDPAVRRDFSDFAILRASVAAVVAAYLMLVVLNMVVAALSFPGRLDPSLVLASLPFILAMAFDPMALFMGVVILSCFAMLGLFILAAQNDHTTYRGAFRAGVITGAVIAAVPLFFAAVSMLATGSFAILPDAALGVLPWALVALVTGGFAGLAGRFAAGPPSVMLQDP